MEFDLNLSPAATLFGESQSRAVLSAGPGHAEGLASLARDFNLPLAPLGRVGGLNFRLRAGAAALDIPLAEMTRLHQAGLEHQIKG